MTAEAFAVLVPVKSLAAAKSRLALDPPRTRQLMRAFAQDAVAAALASPAVAKLVVVSPEPGVVTGDRVMHLPDEGDGDLNTALTRAEQHVRTAEPHLGVAALCADLPCLVENDVTRALAGGGTGRWFVADADGTGTTLLAARPGIPLGPLFGSGSARRHEASGAVALIDPLPTLRRDVDTPEDLCRAAELGLGAHTAALLDPSSWPA